MFVYTRVQIALWLQRASLKGSYLKSYQLYPRRVFDGRHSAATTAEPHRSERPHLTLTERTLMPHSGMVRCVVGRAACCHRRACCQPCGLDGVAGWPGFQARALAGSAAVCRAGTAGGTPDRLCIAVLVCCGVGSMLAGQGADARPG